MPHNSPSSHFPLDISDSPGLFSEEDFGGEDVEGFSYSSPRLGFKQCCGEAAPFLVGFSVQLLRARVCTFIRRCDSPKLQPGGTGTGRIPPVTSGARSGAGSWCFLFFPHALSKGSWPRGSASWLGFCLGKVVLTTGTLGLCLMWQGGRNLRWVAGSRRVWGDEGGIVSEEKLFLQPVARGCPSCVMEGALRSCRHSLHPPAVMPSVKHRLWRKDYPSWLQKAANYTSPLLKRAIVFELANHPAQVSFNFS